MELEPSQTDPLLSDKALPIFSPNAYEDNIPVYHEFAAQDPFSFFETLRSCSCIRPRAGLLRPEYQAFSSKALECKRQFSMQDPEHKRVLNGLWNELFGDEPKLISERWKDIGFQNADPSSDFRSGGLFAARQLLVFVENNREISKKMVKNQENSQFLLAISSINASFFLKRYFLMAEPVDYRLMKEKAVCSRSGFKSFCGMLLENGDLLDRLHELIMKDLYFTWEKRKETDPTLNIMAFNKVFSEIQSFFNKKFIKTHQKGLEVLEKAYETHFLRLEK